MLLAVDQAQPLPELGLADDLQRASVSRLPEWRVEGLFQRCIAGGKASSPITTSVAEPSGRSSTMAPCWRTSCCALRLDMPASLPTRATRSPASACPGDIRRRTSSSSSIPQAANRGKKSPGSTALGTELSLSKRRKVSNHEAREARVQAANQLGKYQKRGADLNGRRPSLNFRFLPGRLSDLGFAVVGRRLRIFRSSTGPTFSCGSSGGFGVACPAARRRRCRSAGRGRSKGRGRGGSRRSRNRVRRSDARHRSHGHRRGNRHAHARAAAGRGTGVFHRHPHHHHARHLLRVDHRHPLLDDPRECGPSVPRPPSCRPAPESARRVLFGDHPAGRHGNPADHFLLDHLADLHLASAAARARRPGLVGRHRHPANLFFLHHAADLHRHLADDFFVRPVAATCTGTLRVTTRCTSWFAALAAPPRWAARRGTSSTVAGHCSGTQASPRR